MDHRKPRYRVGIYGRISPTAPLGSIDVEHSFTVRHKAESFAHEIAKYLPPGPDSAGNVQAWVLVYALAMFPTAGDPFGHCYLSFDPGGVLVKRHQIHRGYWGYGSRMRTVCAGSVRRGA